MNERRMLVPLGFLLFAIMLLSARPVSASMGLTTNTSVVCTPTTVVVDFTTSCTATVTEGNGNFGTDTFTFTQTGGSGTVQGGVTCTIPGGGDSCVGTIEADSAGTASIQASFSGDSDNAVSTGESGLINLVLPPTLTASCATVLVGAQTTCIATLTGGDSPTGTVTFTQNGGPDIVSLPSPTCTLASQVCSIPVQTTGAGTATFQAVYSGDSNNPPVTQPNGIALTVSRQTSVTMASCTTQTIVIGQPTTCTATITGYMPTGTITWTYSGTGTIEPNVCNVPPASCQVSFAPSLSGTLTATYSGDLNNVGSSDTITISANINEKIQITVADSAPPTNVAISGCGATPSTIPANGMPFTFQAVSNCSPITVTLPAAGTNSRYLTSGDNASLNFSGCSSSSCQTITATIYYQVENTYEATPQAPATWSSPGSIAVTGTSLGTSGQTICTIAVATGSGQFSCQGWTDYDTQATLGTLGVSPNQRWATGESSFTQTSGGNTNAVSYYLQVLEDFQYSLVGSTTAPAAPSLDYASFGTATASPLAGASSSFWLDSGSSWTVPATLQGSTSSERWMTLLTNGSATAGATVALTYYHQYLVGFGYSVVGGGTGYQAPSVQFTAFGAATTGSQGWVDAGSAYSYTNPLADSTASQRWFSSAATGAVSQPGDLDAVFYHQYAFDLNFSVIGGGAYSNPRLNYTSLGAQRLSEVNSTAAALWLDSGTNWGVTPLLPSSTSSEQWVTKQLDSGSASSPLDQDFLYHHQYLATISYSIQGSGGSPPVPGLNYTSLGTGAQAQLAKTAASFWMDANSNWAVPTSLPGVQGERWFSNVTYPVQVTGFFQADVQYTHQFYVEAGVSNAAGGQVGNVDQWEDQGASVVLNATTAKSWSFAYWKGETSFSYNGTTRMANLIVTGPANETAVFFPGLTIFASGPGSVAYSYGSTIGMVRSGSNATIYPPPGSNVTLTAMPKSVDIKFQGWTGQLTSTEVQSSVAITIPGAAHASFGTDYTDIRTFAIATIGIFGAAVYVFVARRGFIPSSGKRPSPGKAG